jgi:hypothetical protein
VLKFQADGVSLKTNGTTELKLTIVWIGSNCNGPVTISADRSALSFALALDADSEGRPVVTLNSTVGFTLRDLNIDFGCGGIAGDLLNAIIGSVENQLTTTIQQVITELVTKLLSDVGAVLDTIPTQLPLPAPFAGTVLR